MMRMSGDEPIISTSHQSSVSTTHSCWVGAKWWWDASGI